MVRHGAVWPVAGARLGRGGARRALRCARRGSVGRARGKSLGGHARRGWLWLDHPRALSPSLSLSLLYGVDLLAPFLSTARSPTTFSSPYPFRSRTLLAHFPSLTCTLSRTLSPPLLPYARDQTSSATAHL